MSKVDPSLLSTSPLGFTLILFMVQASFSSSTPKTSVNFITFHIQPLAKGWFITDSLIAFKSLHSCLFILFWLKWFPRWDIILPSFSLYSFDIPYGPIELFSALSNNFPMMCLVGNTLFERTKQSSQCIPELFLCLLNCPCYNERIWNTDTRYRHPLNHFPKFWALLVPGHRWPWPKHYSNSVLL